jgi:hypothetical protein
MARHLEADFNCRRLGLGIVCEGVLTLLHRSPAQLQIPFGWRSRIAKKTDIVGGIDGCEIPLRLSLRRRTTDHGRRGRDQQAFCFASMLASR